MDNLKLRIIDEETGEILPLNKRKSDVENYVKSLPDKSKAELLRKVLFFKKLMEVTEDTVKGYVKELPLEFDDYGKAIWEEFKIAKIYSTRFDQKKFDAEASELEKNIVLRAKQVEEKYKKGVSYIRF